MNVKRTIVLTIVLAITIVSLFGCSPAPSDADKSPDDSTPTNGGSPGSDKKEDPVVITMHVSSDEDEFDKGRQKRFMDKYPNIIIDKKVVAETDGSDALVMFAAGTNPDVGSVSMPQFQNYMYVGLPKALDDYIESWDGIDNIKAEMLNNYKVNGKIYGIPTEAYNMVLVYNKNMFAEADLKPPKTWDELYDCAVKLTDPAKGRWGFNLISVWTEWWFQYFVWQAGGDLTIQNDDGTIDLTFTDPAVEKAIEYYRKLIAAKVVQPDMTMDYGTMQDQFVAGNAAMTLYGSDALKAFVNSGMNPDDIGYAPLPIGPSGETVGQLGGKCSFIYSNISDEKADAVWKWITYEQSKEEAEASLVDGASKGGAAPQVMLRKDIDISLGDINSELQAVVDEVTPYSRLEFAGKSIVGSFVDTAVQKTMLDPSLDIMEEFARQEELAQVEIDKYNESILNPSDE